MSPIPTQPFVTRVLGILTGVLMLTLVVATAFAGTAEGIKAFNAGDYQNAYVELMTAAKSGDPEAQYYLGSMYSNGHGVTHDQQKARQLFRQGAESGNAKAQASLGYMYSKGLGGRENRSAATKWYRKAAEQGHVIAQRNLGLLYEHGEGIERDYSLAVKWFRRAAEQEDGIAQSNICELYQFGFGVPQDHRRAAYWCRRAAENGNPAAQSALQSMILQGLANGDAVSAYAWALYSARQDYPGGLQAWKRESRKWFLSEEQAERARAIVESGEWPVHPRFTEAEQERLRQRGSGRVIRMH